MALGLKALMGILILATAVIARPDVIRQRRFINFGNTADRLVERAGGFLTSFNNFGTSLLGRVGGTFTNFWQNNKGEISSKIKETTLKFNKRYKDLTDVVKSKKLENNVRSIVDNLKPSINEVIKKLSGAVQKMDIKSIIAKGNAHLKDAMKYAKVAKEN